MKNMHFICAKIQIAHPYNNQDVFFKQVMKGIFLHKKITYFVGKFLYTFILVFFHSADIEIVTKK